MTELQQTVSTPCDSEDLIDDVLRGYLGLTVKYKGLLYFFSFIPSSILSVVMGDGLADLTTS